MGKKIVLTGGARGIGRAVVENLASEGHEIAFNYKASKDDADQIVRKIADNNGTAFAFQSDISDYEQAGEFIKNAKEQLGDIDVLINNAGITRDKSLFIMPSEEWNEVINTNLNGCFNVTRHLIGFFMKNKKGNIINVSSVSGIVGVAGQTNYCASKAGIIGFTRSLAREVAKLQIPVNCVAPGYIETDMTAKIPEKHRKELKKMIPMQRFGSVAEVADLISFLVSDKAGYITGHVFAVDGGMTA
ncbi:MAG: 3-oxoacyl-[acyl-carrier-protein] reductase [Chitinivibrionales bacterium]|nr:3-oxoacyl-[acyl-carrier-protein] reductase [Chitinivibrionales bacterium]